MIDAEAVVPPKKNRKLQGTYNESLYADRNKIERFIRRIKYCRRVATRYGKKAQNYLGFAQVASIMTLLL